MDACVSARASFHHGPPKTVEINEPTVLGRFPRCERLDSTAMIAWCEERVELFKALSDEVDAFLEPIQESHGISKEWIERAMEQSMKDAKGWPIGD